MGGDWRDAPLPPLRQCALKVEPAFGLISGLPFPLSANGFLSLFEWFTGNTPRRDSSGTCGLSFPPRRPAAGLGHRCPRGLPVLVHDPLSPVSVIPPRIAGNELPSTRKKRVLTVESVICGY
jgi:hypothetical protein